MQNTSPNLDIIRKTAFTDLDRAVLYALENTIGYLKANKYEIEHTTIDTYEYYKICTNKSKVKGNSQDGRYCRQKAKNCL